MMARLGEAIYELLEANLTIPSIFEGVASSDTNIDEGSLTFTRLPSVGSDMTTGTSLIEYQFSIRHSDFGMAQDYKEELIDLLLGWSGNLSTDFRSVNFFMQSELGELHEDESQMWHLPLIFNIKYIR